MQEVVPLGGRSTTILLTRLLFLVSILAAVLFVPQGVVGQGFGELQSSGVSVIEVDSFTYRTTFRLADGTDALLMRGLFVVYWFGMHQTPFVNEHRMSVTIGFYYGRTMLGRSVVQEARTDGVGFYPWWHDSAGWEHDTFPGTPLCSVTGTIADSEMLSGMLLMDPESQAILIPDFGGTLVINRLTLVMSDGSEYVAIEETLEIRLEKNYNDVMPHAATLSGPENVSYVSSTELLTVTVTGSAPLILWIDLVAGVSLIGAGAVLLILTGLHLLGRIRLPTGRWRRIVVHLLRARADRKTA
jgi:hypothetical protein